MLIRLFWGCGAVTGGRADGGMGQWGTGRRGNGSTGEQADGGHHRYPPLSYDVMDAVRLLERKVFKYLCILCIIITSRGFK